MEKTQGSAFQVSSDGPGLGLRFEQTNLTGHLAKNGKNQMGTVWHKIKMVMERSDVTAGNIFS